MGSFHSFQPVQNSHEDFAKATGEALNLALAHHFTVIKPATTAQSDFFTNIFRSDAVCPVRRKPEACLAVFVLFFEGPTRTAY